MDMGMLSLIGILLALVLLVWGSFIRNADYDSGPGLCGDCIFVLRPSDY